MTFPVLVLALGAAFAGLVQFAPFWHPITDWLEPVAASLVEPSDAMETFASVLAVGLGLAGILVAYLVYVAGRVSVPCVPLVRRTLEQKFYFDWLYDRIFYAPSAWVATVLRREFEEPVVLQTGPDLGDTTLATGSLVRRIQTGLLRTYVLFLAAGAAGVVLAFLIAK